MTIGKRNRRSIHVDGIDYHWVVGVRHEHRRCTATIQHASGTGAKLIVDPIGDLLPTDVANAIQFAISSGWQPRENGPQFWIGYNSENERAKQFSLRSSTAPPYWQES